MGLRIIFQRITINMTYRCRVMRDILIIGKGEKDENR